MHPRRVLKTWRTMSNDSGVSGGVLDDIVLVDITDRDARRRAPWGGKGLCAFVASGETAGTLCDLLCWVALKNAATAVQCQDYRGARR